MRKENRITYSIPRSDAQEKISGQAKYIDDYHFEGALLAKTFRSSVPRARISSITYPKMPEGYFIVDSNDIPGENIVNMIDDDMPIFASKMVNYIGEPIALIVGKDIKIINEIIMQIEIVYENLAAFFSIEEALRLNCSQVPIYGEDNLFAEYSIKKGDVEIPLSEGDICFEDTYTTGYQEHFYLETQGVICSYNADELILYGSMQCPYYIKEAVERALNIKGDYVRVIQTTTGGAFGGKEEFPSLIAAQAAVAAFKVKRTVKLIYDRDEDIEFSTKRQPAVINIRGITDKSFKLKTLEVDIKFDAGAYSGLSKVILQRAMLTATGVYNVPNIYIKGKAIATNTVVGGAFRGFGAPQVIFAIERFVNSLSKEIGVEPNEFRERNFLVTGDKSCTDGKFNGEIPLKDILKEFKKGSNLFTTRKNCNIKTGVGYSFFYHGCGFTGNGEKEHIKAEVALKKKEKHIEIFVSNVEMGQGASITLKKIVAHTLGIPLSKIVYRKQDTKYVPNSGPTVASRTIMIVGKLLEDASKEMKFYMNKPGVKTVIKKYIHPKGIEWNEKEFRGDAYNAYSWGGIEVSLEISTLTCEIMCTGIKSIFDIGTPIDKKIVLGQIEGGIIQGIGYAYYEVMNSSMGKILNGNSTDYVIPTFMDVPKIEMKLYKNPYSNGPFGAKGLGEITLIGVAGAFANAVSNALDTKICKIPVRPENLFREVIK